MGVHICSSLVVQCAESAHWCTCLLIRQTHGDLETFKVMRKRSLTCAWWSVWFGLSSFRGRHFPEFLICKASEDQAMHVLFVASFCTILCRFMFCWAYAIYIYINIYKLLVQEESVRACAFRVSQRHCRRDHRHRHHRWVSVKLLRALVCVCSLACGNSVSSTLYSEEISCTGYIAQITIDSAVGWWRDFPLPTDIFAIAPSLTLSLFFLL